MSGEWTTVGDIPPAMMNLKGPPETDAGGGGNGWSVVGSVSDYTDPVLSAQRQFRGLNIAENDPSVFMADLKRRNLAPEEDNRALNLWADQQVKTGRAKSRQSLLGRIGQAAADTLTTAARSTFVGPWADELEGKMFGEEQGALARANSRAIDEEYPVASTVGQLGLGLFGGGVAANLVKNGNLVQKAAGVALGGPLAGVGPAQGFLARRLQNAGTGALYGANYGAGSAEDGQRLEGAKVGAGTGALLGTALDAGTGVARTLIPKLTPQGRSPMADKIESRLQDAQAFRDIGTDPFAPSLGDQGTARLARTVEAMPVIGRIVESPKTATLQAARDAHENIVRSLGGVGSDEEAGLMLQGGLERERASRLQDLPAADVQAAGIEPYLQATRRNTMSPGALQRIADAAAIRNQQGIGQNATTSRGVTVPMARPINETMLIRRSPGGTSGIPGSELTDAELQKIVRPQGEPLSFAARQEALYEQAFRQVPDFKKINGGKNPGLVAAVNLRNALSGVDAQVANDISGQSTVAGGLADRIRNPKSNFTFQDLRDIRTEIGRKLGSFSPFDARLDRSQLKQLYGAVSKDIENALADYANRARINSRISNNRPDYVSPSVADKADGALYAFRRADRYTRLGMARMDRFSSLIGAKTPEQAARMMGTKLRENTSDFGALRSAFHALNPDERQQMAGYIVSTFGRGRPGGREAESTWNFTHFATDWERLGPRGQNLLLSHIPAATRQKLTSLSRVAMRMKDYEATRNFSNSAYAGLPMVGGALFFSGLDGFMSALGSVGTAAAVGKFLTSKQYLNWLTTSYGMGHAGPSAGAVQKAFRKLRVLAGNDKEFGGLVLQAIRAANIAGIEDPKKY